MSELLAALDNNNWQLLAQQWGLLLFYAIVILALGGWIARRASKALIKLLKLRQVDGILAAFIGNVAQVSLFAAVIIAALDALGLETTSLLAVLGAAGLAIGLALKDSLGNLASGVMIVGLRPFREGDYVDTAGISGTITHVRLFNTTLVTPDNRLIIVPNSQITSTAITNYTAMDTRRIDLLIGISYDDDLPLAQQVMMKALEANEKVLSDPAPVILLMELADSSVNFAVRPWVKKEDYWTTRSDLLQQLKQALEGAGCTIPFPQRDVHHHNSTGHNPTEQEPTAHHDD